jgi:hypothetical protein
MFLTLSIRPVSPNSISLPVERDEATALGQDVQHLAADIARRAHDNYPVTHLHVP